MERVDVFRATEAVVDARAAESVGVCEREDSCHVVVRSRQRSHRGVRTDGRRRHAAVARTAIGADRAEARRDLERTSNTEFDAADGDDLVEYVGSGVVDVERYRRAGYV